MYSSCHRPLVKILATAGTIAILASSCTPAQRTKLLFRPQLDFDKADLSIQVESTGRPGEYALFGKADLPRGTELTVAAIRYLHLSQSPLQTNPRPTYSILAYDVVKMQSDSWQTRLPLWQVAPDGVFKETWQINELDLQLAVEPDDQVLFLVTLAPIHNLQEIERQLASGNQQFASQFVQISPAGSRYLQTGQTLIVDLPSGKTNPLSDRPEDINGGWGNRYLPLPDPPNTRQLEFPDHRQTNAPVAQEELLY